MSKLTEKISNLVPEGNTIKKAIGFTLIGLILFGVGRIYQFHRNEADLVNFGSKFNLGCVESQTNFQTVLDKKNPFINGCADWYGQNIGYYFED